MHKYRATRLALRASNTSMKFHLSTSTGNLVTGFGPGWLRVGAQEYRENLMLTPETLVANWAPNGFEGLSESDFKALLATDPEVVLLGTGHAIRFPNAALSRVLMEAHVG